ncbi:MAG TPA: aminotransferase class I/II-fold pyridoxal phosphate-dependent enzyme [Acidimicrobiia bacterium]|nr:aminotransferase class I/II-fold pyridoxal phosphate-dependent enzyme [Acidimicrobiia bacterium]
MATSDRLAPFGVSIFSEMTALAQEHQAINLGQGFPNWDGVDFVKEAARLSLQQGGTDQYPPSQGIPALREAVALRYGPLLGRALDPAREVTITCGCTEALAASFLGLIDPGDEVVLIEPFYDAYPVYVAMSGAIPRYVTLRPPRFELDLDQLRGVISSRTKAIVVNNPHNPTGRVFSDEELSAIARLCVEYDVIAITDEVYEEMTYNVPHLRLANYEGMWERTLTLSSVGKTFSLTGWKVGWGIAPEGLTTGLRSAHQFLTFTTPTPVQHGAVAAMRAPDSFYQDLRSGYLRKRDLLADGLEAVGFDVHRPQGTYFMMAGFEEFGFTDDRAFCRHLVETARVVAIPPSFFYHRREDGSSLVRFAFCKDESILSDALDRLRVLAG